MKISPKSQFSENYFGITIGSQALDVPMARTFNLHRNIEFLRLVDNLGRHQIIKI